MMIIDDDDEDTVDDKDGRGLDAVDLMTEFEAMLFFFFVSKVKLES